MKSELILLRHGITEGNKNRWFYGGLDLPLIEEGKEELARLRDAGFYPEVPKDARFFTTGMIRTEETLEIIFGKREHRAIEDLKEMCFGEYEAKSFDELKEDEVFLEWGYDSTGDVKLPGAESKNEFNERVHRGAKELLAEHHSLEIEKRHKEEPIVTVLICHGGVVSSIMELLFPGNRETMWDWMTAPGSGYIVEFTDGKATKYSLLGDMSVYYMDEDEE